MKKKLLSLLLVFSMLLGCTGTVFAVEAEEPEWDEGAFSEEASSEDADALAAWEASLGEYTETPANAYTPAETKNLLTAEDTGHAYDPDMGEEDETPVSAEYVPGEVLFSRMEGGISLFGDGDIEGKLAALGVSDAEKIASFTEKSSGVSLFSAEREEVWYQASVSGDVLDTVDALKELSGIENAEPNYLYTTEAVGEPSAAQIANQWYIGAPDETGIMDEEHGNKDNNGLHKGWYKHWNKDWEEGDEIPAEDEQTSAPGTGAVVAVIDTGVDYTHEDLASSMWTNDAELNGLPGVDDDGNGYIDDIYGINTTANPRFDGAKAGDPMDNNGHGTHVAGIIAMANNDVGGVGVAYGAKIMAIKAGQATGTFSSADIQEAIEYAVAMGADVINMSFGGTGKSALVEEALEDAFSTCVLVAAAGNDGLPTNDAQAAGFLFTEDIYPASYRYVLGVMASNEAGQKAGFSNWDFISNANAEYEMIAPGTNIYSTVPGNQYAEWNGTSMATPIVAASAAVIRGYFTDKDEYNSRFIMGQLASATDDKVQYIDELNYLHSYASLNLYDSMENLPKPNLAVSEVFALDNVRTGTENDGDRIIDAGETIDLGIAIRNQWGKTGTVTVTADDLSASAQVPTDFIEFIDNEITLEPIGTYSEADNGYVWDDSLLIDVDNPIRFRVKEDTPNDSQITINLTITTTNGLDEGDAATYTTHGSFTFRVQKGVGIRGHITQDTTLTNDKYWIIENSLIVDPGVTLTVEEGTQIQFWSSDEKDGYEQITMAYLKNDGTLNMIGTEAEPIEIFPGAGFENYVCEISGSGVETLKYCNIVSPRMGYNGSQNEQPVNSCDHCTFTQNYTGEMTRYLHNGRAESTSFYSLACGFSVSLLTNSILKNFRFSSIDNNNRPIHINNGKNNAFYNCAISIYGSNDSNYCFDLTNSVLLGKGDSGYTNIAKFQSLTLLRPTIDSILYNDVTDSKYIVMEPYSIEQERALMRALATQLGGTLACFSDEAERNLVRDLLAAEQEKTRVPSQSGVINGYYYIGYEYDAEQQTFCWDNVSTYKPKISESSNPVDYPYCILQIQSYESDVPYGRIVLYENSYYSRYPYLLECPATLSDEDITRIISTFNYESWFRANTQPYTYHCAILNPVLDTNPDGWTRFTAPSYDGKNKYLLHGNYWGTENDILINKMIQDDDDFAGTLADIDEKPILTLESPELEDIYPFVTSIYMTEQDGDTVVTDAAPGVTYDVHVTYNRNMAQDIQPSITYGGEAPYTDYTVHGDWKSDREWVGTTKISSVSTGGTQVFRAKGGAAADDRWLVCGTDELRFDFDINTTSAQSMVLNATAESNAISLRWAQNDYETLAGYNVYRSTSATGTFTKINDTTLVTDSQYYTFTDTNVQQGTTYYYYVTVVDTDGNEIPEAKTNIASATPLDNVKPTVTHTPVTSAKANTDVTVAATVSDNVDAAKDCTVNVYYRVHGAENYTKKALTYSTTTGKWSGTIPKTSVTAAGVDYYLEVKDSAGNAAYAQSAANPYFITTSSTPTLLMISPDTVSTGATPTLTLTGSNFAEGMTVKVGTKIISDYTVSEDGTEITFTAPSLPIGSYIVSVTKGETTVKLKTTNLVYRDTTAGVQLGYGSVLSGEKLTLPLTMTAAGEVTAFHAEITVPKDKLTVTNVELNEAIAAALGDKKPYLIYDYNVGSGELIISVSGNDDFNIGSGLLANVTFTPKTVAAETNAAITLLSGKINGAEMVTAAQDSNVTIYPNFSLKAVVQYFKDAIGVGGAKITAATGTGTTDSTGSVTITGINNPQIVALISKNDYVDSEANVIDVMDAVKVLEVCVKRATLTDNEKIAADVNGDGNVDEVDASYILKYIVKREITFPAGAWSFTPEAVSKTLTSTVETVNFTAILIGDVNGSWATWANKQ